MTAEQVLARLREVVGRARADGYAVIDVAMLVAWLDTNTPDRVPSGRSVCPRSGTIGAGRCAGPSSSAPVMVGPAGDGEWITVTAAAASLGVSRERVRRLSRMGRLGPAVRGPRRTWRIPRAAVDRLMEARHGDH